MLAGVPMMNGAATLEGYVPEIDATVATRILDAGGTILGKAHCENFCLSGGSHTNVTGPVHTPYKMGYSAGGSSSGSAVLVALGEVAEQEADDIALQSRRSLEHELERLRQGRVSQARTRSAGGVWERYRGGAESDVPECKTALTREELVELLAGLSTLPSGFSAHPRVKRLLAARRAMADGARRVDWGAAEALAFASLLAQGVSVRLSGQDSQRGTFAHRHAVIHDASTDARCVPLERFADQGNRFEVFNSPLSETAVLGFEFGYSLNRPDALVLWEAQFGDFANVAQVIVDQFLSSSEEKWGRLSGLTLLLPHGFEGQGPEHSHARPERFLQLGVGDNLQVVMPSTAAQFFHCLRRQVLRRWRKPLIVFTPKGLLQHPCLASTLDDFSHDGFRRVIGDDNAPAAASAARLVLCSGKLYHEIDAERRKRQRHDVHCVRLEQLYPFPAESLGDVLASYPPQVPLVWAQEEPENMGARAFVREYLSALPQVGSRTITHIARPPSASPATGSLATHTAQQSELLDRVLAGG